MPEAGHTPEHKEGQDGKLTEENKAADTHAADSHAHGADAHGADSHGHGHDDHAVPADAIPEGSAIDTVLSSLALLVGVALVGLIVYWCSLKPALVAEAEPGEHPAVHGEAPANTEPAPLR
jgi:hypothetical protein